ncbi:hypothetical protein [Bradyrhizobium arachidis]|uniref:hypothetical protein n=1 Tax=Bradyrhizobium arachidis TaxID=858423 RepID=UPI0021616FFF|nr:hypothetical protein [Bradyrhizobium arachidis]UVO30731.1 hypothetical protein KUF59_08795 [Bradyrhizobium arachidis]
MVSLSPSSIEVSGIQRSKRQAYCWRQAERLRWLQAAKANDVAISMPTLRSAALVFFSKINTQQYNPTLRIGAFGLD